MRKITDYTKIMKIGIATLAAAVNIGAAEQSAERMVADYMRQNYRGKIWELPIESIDGGRINVNLIFRNVYDGRGELRDEIIVTQPISGEDAAKNGLDLPSGQLGMINDEPQNKLDEIVNTAYIDSRSRRVFMVLNLTDEGIRKYIQSLYRWTISKAYDSIRNKNVIKA